MVASVQRFRNLVENDPEFQSPSLRGSGRFVERPPPHGGGARRFQSPSLRGSGRFRMATERMLVLLFMFQSPSLRGSGRFFLLSPYQGEMNIRFQSPSLRGSGRFCRRMPGYNLDFGLVSIPFIAGQWSLHPGFWAS